MSISIDPPVLPYYCTAHCSLVIMLIDRARIRFSEFKAQIPIFKDTDYEVTTTD